MRHGWEIFWPSLILMVIYLSNMSQQLLLSPVHSGGKYTKKTAKKKPNIKNLAMVHAIALRPRARSIVRGVDPFYIRNTAPGGKWWCRDFCIQRFVTKKYCNSQYLESRSHCASRNFRWKNVPCWDMLKERVWCEDSGTSGIFEKNHFFHLM